MFKSSVCIVYAGIYKTALNNDIFSRVAILMMIYIKIVASVRKTIEIAGYSH